MKTTVRSLTSVFQLDGGKTYFDLPVIFERTVAECHAFCQKEKKYKWQFSPEMLFGGYYVDENV